MNRARRNSSQGFSLLELLVALAIMAMALGMLYRAIGGSARTVGDVSRYSQAVIIGESVLQLREAVPAEGWQDAGVWEGFRWSVASAPYALGDSRELPLHRVQVDVAWVDGAKDRNFSLVTLRPQLADRAEAAPR